MRIVVAYKWTCDPEEATVRADGTVDWSRAKPGISTYDPVAMELARRLAEASGAELIGLTAGGKGVGTSHRGQGRPLPRPGAGWRSSRMSPCGQPGGPSWPRSLPRRSARSATWTSIITGDSSVDVAAKMVPTVLAGLLGWPAVAEVTAVTGQVGSLRVERAIPGGVQVLEISGPAVLAASADAAVPHVPGMKELLAAAKKPADQLALTALDVPAPNAAMTVTGQARPERRARKGQLIDTADPVAAAAELVTALRAAGAL